MLLHLFIKSGLKKQASSTVHSFGAKNRGKGNVNEESPGTFWRAM